MSVNGYSRGWNAAVEACAKRIESAGCISAPCGENGAPQAKHDPQCPKYLAAALCKELGEELISTPAEKQLLACGHPIVCDGLAGENGDQPGCGWCADIADNGILIDHLSRTYDHFSGGRISKPLTLPEEVFVIADDIATKEMEEARAEWLQEKDQER